MLLITAARCSTIEQVKTLCEAIRQQDLQTAKDLLPPGFTSPSPKDQQQLLREAEVVLQLHNVLGPLINNPDSLITPSLILTSQPNVWQTLSAVLQAVFTSPPAVSSGLAIANDYGGLNNFKLPQFLHGLHFQLLPYVLTFFTATQRAQLAQWLRREGLEHIFMLLAQVLRDQWRASIADKNDHERCCRLLDAEQKWVNRVDNLEKSHSVQHRQKLLSKARKQLLQQRTNLLKLGDDADETRAMLAVQCEQAAKKCRRQAQSKREQTENAADNLSSILSFAVKEVLAPDIVLHAVRARRKHGDGMASAQNTLDDKLYALIDTMVEGLIAIARTPEDGMRLLSVFKALVPLAKNRSVDLSNVLPRAGSFWQVLQSQLRADGKEKINPSSGLAPRISGFMAAIVMTGPPMPAAPMRDLFQWFATEDNGLLQGLLALNDETQWQRFRDTVAATVANLGLQNDKPTVWGGHRTVAVHFQRDLALSENRVKSVLDQVRRVGKTHPEALAAVMHRIEQTLQQQADYDAEQGKTCPAYQAPFAFAHFTPLTWLYIIQPLNLGERAQLLAKLMPTLCLMGCQALKECVLGAFDVLWAAVLALTGKQPGPATRPSPTLLAGSPPASDSGSDTEIEPSSSESENGGDKVSSSSRSSSPSRFSRLTH